MDPTSSDSEPVQVITGSTSDRKDGDLDNPTPAARDEKLFGSKLCLITKVVKDLPGRIVVLRRMANRLHYSWGYVIAAVSCGGIRRSMAGMRAFDNM